MVGEGDFLDPLGGLGQGLGSRVWGRARAGGQPSSRHSSGV